MANDQDQLPVDDNQTAKPTDDQLEAAADEELGTGPADVHDPASPHAVAPQIQDEEAEKADVVEEAADAHPEPAAEEIVRTDLDSVKRLNQTEETKEEKE